VKPRWTTGLAVLVCAAIVAPAAPAAASGPPPAGENAAPVGDPYPAFEELVMGAGSRGPYLLSWTNVTPATEAVSLNGKRIHHGLDYSLDYAKGTVQFTVPLAQGDVAQVEYRYDRALAKPNPSATRLPLSLNVWQRGTGSLQLIGLVPANPNAPGSAPVLGLTAQLQRPGGKFNTLFLMNTTPGSPASDQWDRAALRFGGATGLGGMKLAGSYLQAGSQFAGTPDPQLAAGLRQYDLSLAYDPSQRLSFSSKVERVDALQDSKRGQERALESHRIAVTPTESSRLSLTREVRGKTRPDGRREESAVNRAQIDQKYGRKTAATALVERSEVRGATVGEVDRTALTLTTNPSRRARITGGFIRNDAGEAGAEATSSLSLNASPTDRLKLNTQLSRRTSERAGDLNAIGFDWNARAARRIGLEGAFSRQEGEKSGTDDAQRLRLSLGPLSVEGQRRERDALAGPDELEELLRLEAGLWRGLRLGGTRGNRVAGPAQAMTDLSEAFVEINPDPAFRFRGSVQSAVTGDVEARTTALSAAVKAPGLLEVSGSYKAREADAQSELISRDYMVALMPVRGFTLQGAYRENPEDKNGRILDQIHTSLGLQSRLGSVGLSGAYTAIETGPTSRGAEELELKLTLGLAAKTRLYSGYKERETREASLLRDRTFSLGFTRTVGNSLFLLLEGEYTLSERDGQLLDEAGDTRANARLGVRF
jgi:hypothetical protein